MWISKDLKVSLTPLQEPPTVIQYGFVDAKFGRLLIGIAEAAIIVLNFVPTSDLDAVKKVHQRWTKAKLVQDDQLITEYNEKLFKRGKVVEVAVHGTEFQLAVYNALLGIDVGSTCTYSGLAQLIDKPKAVRAVANAVAKNPISVLIPCHRIVSVNGELKYHWGTQLKVDLLNYEADKLINVF